MSDVDKQIDDLRAELAEAKAANEALKEKVVAEQQAEFETKIQSLEATIAEQATKLQEQAAANEAIAESLKQAEEAIAMKDEDMKKKMDELREMKKKEAKYKRMAQLEELGLESEAIEATLANFEESDDQVFDKLVTALAAMPKMKGEKHDDKEEEKAVKKDAKAEVEEEVDAAEASEEVLDDVEESADVAIAEAIGEDDPSATLRSVASEWLGSVLQHTPKN